MEEVKAVFNSLTTPIEIHSIGLYIQRSGDTIPADVLGRSPVTSYIGIIGKNNFPSVRVDPDAFRSSRFTVEKIEFQKLDVSQVDFRFLAGSTQIDQLNFFGVSNIHRSLPTIPDLPSLRQLRMYVATGLNQEWQNGSVFYPGGLVSLTAFECGLDDFGVGQLLDWLIPNSAATLRSLSFEANQISSISSKFNSFQSLYSIYIQENKADLTVKNNSFYASINQQMIIDLSGSQVIRVEPNSFIGIFLSFIFNAIIIFKLYYIFFYYRKLQFN